MATVSGGNEYNTGNDTGSDATIVVSPPLISEAFSPPSAAPNSTSTLTVTITNPSGNSTALTGLTFSESLPSGLTLKSNATTTCSGGTVAGSSGGSNLSLSGSGSSLAAGSTCTVSASVGSASNGSYPATTTNITATNSNAGGTASATLTVAVTPTRVVFTSVPPAAITAGGNAGTVSVALEDAAGNIATNNSTSVITIVVTYPSATTQTYQATVTNGVATFNLTNVTLTQSGTYTYVASDPGYTGTSATETVNPGALASVTVSGLSIFTAPQMAGTATVKALDAYGNTVTGFTGTVTLASTTDPTATVTPASYTYTASDAGTHNFTVTFDTAGTETVTATSGSIGGSEAGIVVEDAIWILNASNTVARLTDAGVQTTSSGTASGTSTFGALAFDNAGDIWTVSNAASAVQEYTKAGVAVTVAGSTAAGVSTPTSLFIDGLGQVWVANGNNSISVLSAAGAAVSASTGYTGGSTSGLSTPSGILVDSAGSVWVTNRAGNSVTKIFGAASPVVAPTVTGTTNNTLGTRP